MSLMRLKHFLLWKGFIPVRIMVEAWNLGMHVKKKTLKFVRGTSKACPIWYTFTSRNIVMAWTLLLFYLLQPSNEFSTTERFVLKSGSMHQTNPRLLLIESSLSLKPQNGLLPNPIILKCPLHVFSIQQILSVINSALGLIPTIPRIPSLLPSLIL